MISSSAFTCIWANMHMGQWCSGFTYIWANGAVVSRTYGPMVQWFHVHMGQWCSGFTCIWANGAVVSRAYGPMAECSQTIYLLTDLPCSAWKSKCCSTHYKGMFKCISLTDVLTRILYLQKKLSLCYLTYLNPCTSSIPQT